MGLPMARHLAAHGFATSGYDIDEQRCAALVAAGGHVAATPRALGGTCDAILIMVADDGQVTEVVLGTQGCLESARAGTALIISSTVKPATCTAIADRVRASGVGVLDAPVCRGQRAAEAGTLTVLVGGEAALVERCRPIFEAFGDHVFHLGEQVGAGQVAKMANNLLLWTGVAGTHAALTLAARLGVQPSRLRTALQASSADSWVLRELDRINLTWPDKDLAQVVEMAEELGLSPGLIESVRESIHGLSREDLRRLCTDSALERSEDTGL
jgi:3-hydroxyisobutyrate dehydrogenase-like beta-hydroxyacid dehydrogenase